MEMIFEVFVDEETARGKIMVTTKPSSKCVAKTVMFAPPDKAEVAESKAHHVEANDGERGISRPYQD